MGTTSRQKKHTSRTDTKTRKSLKRTIAEKFVDAAIAALIGVLIQHVIQESKSSAPKWRCSQSLPSPV